MRRTIVKGKRLEVATLVELPPTDWRGGAQWMAVEAEGFHVGYGDTIEEACDALATEPVLRLVEDEEESPFEFREFDAAA